MAHSPWVPSPWIPAPAPSLPQAPRSPWPATPHPPQPHSLWTPKPALCPPSLASPPWPCTRRSAPPPSTRCTPPDPPSTTPQVSTAPPLQPHGKLFGGTLTDPPFLRSTTALRPRTAQLPRRLSPLGDPASTGDTLGHPWVASEHGLGAPVVVPPPQAVTPPYEADGWIWPFPAIVGTRSTEPLLSPRPPRTLGPLWVPAGSSGPTHGGAMPGVPLPAGTGGALWDPRSPRTLGSSQAGGIKLCPPPRVVSCWWLCAPCPRSNGEGRGAQFFFFGGGGLEGQFPSSLQAFLHPKRGDLFLPSPTTFYFPPNQPG